MTREGVEFLRLMSHKHTLLRKLCGTFAVISPAIAARGRSECWQCRHHKMTLSRQYILPKNYYIIPEYINICLSLLCFLDDHMLAMPASYTNDTHAERYHQNFYARIYIYTIYIRLSVLCFLDGHNIVSLATIPYQCTLKNRHP